MTMQDGVNVTSGTLRSKTVKYRVWMVLRSPEAALMKALCCTSLAKFLFFPHCIIYGMA